MSITNALRDHLLTHGPCTDVELHARVVEAGLTKAKTSAGVRSSLQSSHWAVRLPDGRWDVAARRLRGAILTVRPRAVLRDGVLWTHRDLEPFASLYVARALPLASGGTVHRGDSQPETMLGPPGWLPPLSPDGVLGLRWTGTALEVAHLTQLPAVDDARVVRARALFALHATHLTTSYGRPTPDLERIVLSALLEDPDLLREPLPPLSELLPLPEPAFDDPGIWEAHGNHRRVTLHVPTRVYGELERRSRMLGDRLPDYAAMLLGASLDRVTPPVTYEEPRSFGAWREEPWEPYEDDVVRQLRRPD
jgi:hypothetical protein